MSRTRIMSLGQRLRSQSAHNLFAYASLNPLCVRSITFSCMVGFKNNLAQMIIMTRQCVTNKNQFARSKVKATVCTETLCIGFTEIHNCHA